MNAPDRWLALVRIVVGAWFLKSMLTKLTIVLVGGVLPVPAASDRWVATMPRLLARYAAENPFPAYKAFLLGAAREPVFAELSAFGETVVGLSLTLGLLTRLGATIGLVQVVFYGLAVQHMSSGQQGFHVLLFTAMLAFIGAAAGRRWGIDGWLVRRSPNGWVARLRLG